MHHGASMPAGQRHGDGKAHVDVALGWMGRGVGEHGSGDVATKGRAMEKGRLHLTRFVPEFKNSSFFFLGEAGLSLPGSATSCFLPSMEALPAPRSPAGAPSLAP